MTKSEAPVISKLYKYECFADMMLDELNVKQVVVLEAHAEDKPLKVYYDGTTHVNFNGIDVDNERIALAVYERVFDGKI